MPRSNRVTPFGTIIAVPERGALMGNRGRLHDRDGQIRRSWQLQRWILCLLDFKGRHRVVMTPGFYTELFFLDEATGLAAGHRPCAECRRTRFLEFRNAWVTGNSPPSWGGPVPLAPALDARLHSERIGPDSVKKSYRSALDEIPDGVFVTLDDEQDHAFLVRSDDLLEWSPGGYHRRRKRPKNVVVSVLTPRSTVEAIRAGYVPSIHRSARDVVGLVPTAETHDHEPDRESGH